MKTKRILLLAVFALFTSLCFSKETFGFRQLKTYKYTPGTQVVYYEHVKSGARLVWFKNNDTNRAFNLAFQTRSYDDVGLPHIFEHSCLAGSNKYPSSNLFFQMGAQTYNTFMNALTYQNFTCYPMGSLSEEQLFTSLDVYMNGVFDPIVLTQENDLKREAVRFVLNSPDEQITATGAVYNELLGSMSNKGTFHYYNLRKVLFPQSTDSFITGGKPEDILKVTWQDVKDYHKKYYQPSNMVIYLYGKLDVERFLKYFDDEFLSKYERTHTDLSDTFYQKWEGHREQTFEFPVSKDTQTVNSSILSYNFTLPDATPENFNDLRVINNYLGKESSWLGQTMKERFPNANYYCGFNNFCRYPYYEFYVENINEEDKDELKQIFEEAVNQLCRQKIDKTNIELFANGFKMDTILDEENPDGVQTLRSAGFLWSISDDPVNIVTYRNNLLKLPKTSTPESLMATANKLLASPEQSVLVITKPVAGLSEKKAEETAKYFADKKAAMSKQQIDDLIADNKQYNEWISENEKINLIDKVKVVSAKNLPEEATDVSIIDRKSDGFRVLLGENPGSQYVSASVMFDMNTLPSEYLHPIMLYFSLLESLPTQKHTLDELETKLMLALYSSSFYTCFYNHNDEQKTGGTGIYSVGQFMCLNEKLPETLELIHEVLTQTKLTDYATIRSVASRNVKSKKESYRANPPRIAGELAFVATHPAYTARFYAIRFKYWDFLEKVSQMTDDEMSALIVKINEGLKILYTRQNLTFTCVGDKKQIEKCLKYEKNFAETLGNEELPVQKIFGDSDPLPKSIAVIVPGNSNYCYYAVTPSDWSLDFDAKYYVISSFLSDKYLLPQLRYKYGAYGAGCSISSEGLELSSYRDPEITNTYKVFSQAEEFFNTAEISEADLDGYITSIYSELQQGASNSVRLGNKISRYLSHDYEENRLLRYMKQVKATKAEDALEFARLLKLLETDGVKVTVGTAEQIYANKDYFDLIMTDFIK